MVFVIGQRCVPYPIDLGMLGKVRRHFFGVGRVPFHAERERIRSQPAQKGVLRAHDCAHVPHHLRAAFGGELRRGQVGIHEPVIAFVRLVERRIAGVALKIEVAAVHDHAAERRRVAVHVFARGMDDDVRPPLERAAQDRRGKGVVHNEQHAVFLGYLCNFVKVEDLDGGVGDRFGENEFRLVVDELFDLFRRRVGIEKAGLYPQFGQSDRKQVECAAVDRGGRNDVVARAADGESQQRGRRHARRTSDARHAPFEFGGLSFERRNGGVCKAGIKIAVRL